MIPSLIQRPNLPCSILPPGLHQVSLRDFRDFFVFNQHRAWLFEGMKLACYELRESGCSRIYVGGSFVTSKEFPSDYDACWDPAGVLPSLDPVMYDDNLFTERKAKYRGDLLIGGVSLGPAGESYRFLSRDKLTSDERGMIGIKLNMLEIMNL